MVARKFYFGGAMLPLLLGAGLGVAAGSVFKGGGSKPKGPTQEEIAAQEKAKQKKIEQEARQSAIERARKSSLRSAFAQETTLGDRTRLGGF